MNELEKLRPEVAHSVSCCDAEPFSDGAITHWPAVRAELLRLADENKRMRGIIETLGIEGHRRAEKAEAELAALKARIAEGVYMGYPVECYVGNRRGQLINPFTPAEWIGKRVRLLVEE